MKKILLIKIYQHFHLFYIVVKKEMMKVIIINLNLLLFTFNHFSKYVFI